MAIAREVELWQGALRGMRARRPVEFEHRVEPGPLGARLLITMVTVDSRDGVTPVRPTKTVDCPPFTTARAARDLLREKMQNMVLHELSEWIEVDGGRPYYPHGGWEAACRS